MVAKHLVEKTNYLNKDVVYLKNTIIREYDIKSAGFNTIKYKKLLPQNEIERLETIEKEDRNIQIGKMIIKYPKLGEELISTLVDARKDFVILNNIEEDDILSIKKDAVYLIKLLPSYTKILDYFEFRPKNSYTSYCLLNNKEFYFSITMPELDIKGIPEDSKKLQKDHLLKDIYNMMRISEKVNEAQLFDYLKKYRSQYLNRQLDKNAYRNLDTGKFDMDGYQIQDISDSMVKDIDITHNYMYYIMPLFRAML